jgi:hypothetical protein
VANESLYERLGGEKKIRAIATRYEHGKKSDAEIIDLVVDRLGSSTGGPRSTRGWT